MPIQHVRAPDEDWADLDTASDGRRPEVVRELIRWYLRRPGARLPERPQARDWAAERAEDALRWFTSLGHAVTQDELQHDKDGQPVWQCGRCDSTLTITLKGKVQSPTGKTQCPGGSGA